MTEDRKPETPGLAEVSAKFAHGAEAAVEAAVSTDEALFALWQERERLRQQYDEAIEKSDLAFTAKLDITETETPEYLTAAAAHEAAEQHQQETSDAIVAAENRMAKMPAHTIKGALLKLRVVGVEITDEIKGRDGVLDETLLSSERRLTLSARDDLDRLVSAATAKDTALSALWEEWQRLWEANENATEVAQDDELASKIFRTLVTVERRMEDREAAQDSLYLAMQGDPILRRAVERAGVQKLIASGLARYRELAETGGAYRAAHPEEA